jgi:hypothetical protein
MFDSVKNNKLFFISHRPLIQLIEVTQILQVEKSIISRAAGFPDMKILY